MNEDGERGARCGLLSGKHRTLHRDVFRPMMRSYNGILKTTYLFEGKRPTCMRMLHKTVYGGDCVDCVWGVREGGGWNARHAGQTLVDEVLHTNNDRCSGPQAA